MRNQQLEAHAMNWKLDKKIDTSEQVLSARFFNDSLFLRTSNEIICLDCDLERRWSSSLSDDQRTVGEVPILFIKDLIVTVEDFGNAQPSILKAVNIGNGKIDWSCKLNGRISNFGLAILDDSILAHVRNKDKKYVIYKFEPNEGTLLSELSSEVSNGIKIYSGQILLPSHTGLDLINNSTNSKENLYNRHIHALTVSDSYIFFYVEDQSKKRRKSIKCLNERSKEYLCVELPESISDIIKIHHLVESDVVAILHSHGFLVIDFKEKAITNEIKLSDSERALSLAFAANQIVLVYLSSEYDCKGVTYEKMSSTPKADLEVEDIAPSTTFYVGQHLLFCGPNKTAIFSFAT